MKIKPVSPAHPAHIVQTPQKQYHADDDVDGAAFDHHEACIVREHARDGGGHDEPEGHERAEAPAPQPSLPREGGVFRRFLGGFREDTK